MLRLAERRGPVHLADADRISDDLRRLALFRLRKVVEPMLRQIDDDAFARAGGSRRCPGMTIVVPSPGSQVSTPGLARRISS